MKIRVGLFYKEKDDSWISKKKDFIEEYYSDRYDEIEVRIFPGNEMVCGQRFNATFYDGRISGEIVDTIILPGATLAPGDAFAIYDLPQGGTHYKKIAGYARDRRSPEEKVAAWAEEMGI